MVPDIRRRVATVCVVFVLLCVRAVAQEGYYGVGHDRWHREFYSKRTETTAEAPAVTSWTVARRKAAWLATITRSRWTVNGRRFATIGSTMLSRRMVALMSAPPDR